jgi:anti-sigma factor RsiW
MTCKEIENLLPGMVDGVLPVAEKKRIEAHMATCASCRNALADLRKTNERVRRLEEVEPPPWLKTRVMARVREEAGQKEGLFRKLFYPLHIKIPIEALATVLIAVVAWNVYKTGQPEFRQMATPPAAVQEVTKAPAPHEPVKATAPQPVPAAGDKGIDRRAEAPGKNAFAPPPMPAADQQMQRQANLPEAAKADAAKPAESFATARPAAPMKDEEALKGTGMTVRQEMDRAAQVPARDQKQKAMKAPIGAVAREAGKQEAATAAPPALSSTASPKTEPDMILRVRDPEAAADEAETILKKVSAQAIERQTREGRVILTARVETERLEVFREKLKSLGPVQESVHVAPHTEGFLTIQIEIRPE